METLIPYIVKVNLSLAVFYLLYALLFHKDTFIRLRRYYFLSAIIFSLSYPLFTVTELGNLIDFSTPPPQYETNVYFGDLSMESTVVVDEAPQKKSTLSLIEAVSLIMATGILFFIFRFLWQLLSIIRIKSRSEKRQLYGYTIYHLQDEITPFSFFNWIFIHLEKHTKEELEQILLHEQTHVSQKHSLDVMLAEMLCIAFWYNPIVWFMKRDIAINLEYLADNAVLQKGVDTHEYQCNLLQMNYPETAVQLINNFNVSQLKQRIIMMNSQKSPLRKLAKYLSVLPLALLLITANSVYGQTNDTQQKPVKIENKKNESITEKSKYHEVTENLDKLTDIIKSEINYPNIAKENGVKGDVLVSFIVEEDGSVTNPKIERGTDPSFNTEAIRVISTLPKLEQFTYIVDDEPLRIKYNGHFAFRIDGKKSTINVYIGGYSVQTIADRTGDDKPLFIVDGVKMGKAFNINSITESDIEQKIIYQKEAAIATYGEEGKNGAVLITLKDHSKSSVSNKEKNSEVKVIGSSSMQGETLSAISEIFENNSLLIIVDDVKMPKDFDINSIKPDDIESISVLKDASAKANYGNEGKDGVIVIATKKTLQMNNGKKKDSDQNKTNGDDDVFVVVENQPEFPGGVQALMKFLGDNVRYPVEAMKSGTQGRVITSFVINKDGSISDIEIERGVDPLLDAEAIRVIGMMPEWKPGTQRGQAVNVRFTIPVTFRLNNNEGEVNYEAANKSKETVPAIINNTLGRNRPLIIVDGKKMPRGFDLEQIKPEDIESSHFIQPQTAISTYADEGKDGVLLITTKKGPTLYNVREMNDLYEKGEKARLELKEKGDKAMNKLKDKGPISVFEEKTDNPDIGYLRFISQNIKYPIIAQENGIMGVSRATFDVNGNGEISNVKITESVDPSLDAELVRVTKLIPKDIALIKTKGKAASDVAISVLFRLQDENGTYTASDKGEVDVVVVGYGRSLEKK